MKPYIKNVFISIMAALIMTSCSHNVLTGSTPFDISQPITTLHRENGSGTKLSFLNFLNLNEEDIKEDIDNIVPDNDVMMSAVEANEYAIGYMSHSKLCDIVKTISIDNISPTTENILNETYPFSRTFYLITDENPDELCQDFLDFALSREDIIKQHGYIPISYKKDYTSKKPVGEIKISGSSSVFPLMEILIEEYKTINSNAKIEITKTDSSKGIENLKNDIVHIAMSSRILTKQESAKTFQLKIAKEAIAVIVNVNNPIEDITLDTLKKIYTKKTTTWNIN